MIDQDKFTYFPLRKTFEKQTKVIKFQGKKRVEALQTSELTFLNILINIQQLGM